MRRVYLSPHLDDAVFSCGGLIARQAARGDRVEIVTIFAVSQEQVVPLPETATLPAPCLLPASAVGRALVELWGAPADVGAARRAEDRAACARLGATPTHLTFVEAAFRRDDASGGEACYPTAAHLFGEPHAADRDLARRVAADLGAALAGAGEIYCPAAIGGHVDHRLARRAAESTGLPLTYYEEQPYAARGYPPGAPLPHGVTTRAHFDAGELDLWADAAWDYRMGARTFWRSRGELRVELAVVQDRAGGFAVWSADASTCSYTVR